MNPPSDVSFVVLHTQFSNIGDALINRELLRLLHVHGELCVETSSAPAWFLRMVAMPATVRQVDGSVRLVLAMLRERLRGRRCRFFFLPGGFAGDLQPGQFARKTALLGLFWLLRAAGVGFCHLGVSYERIGPRHARYLRLRQRLMDSLHVRDLRSQRMLQSIGIRASGVLPDLAFNVMPVKAGLRDGIRDVCFSFRTDQHPAQADQVHAAVRQWLACLPGGVTCHLGVQVEHDRPGMERLAGQLSESGVSARAFQETRDIERLLQRYAGMDLVVSNRLHVLLLAAAAGCRVVACIDERNEKIAGLLETLGRTDLMLPLAGLDAAAIGRALAAEPLDARAERQALQEGVARIFAPAAVGAAMKGMGTVSSTDDTANSRPLRVLETVNPPDGTTRYVDQVVTMAPGWVRFGFLSARSLASLDYDVLHVHWPDALLRGRLTWLRCLGLVALLELLRLRRIAVVRTLHNLQPHEPGSRVEALALRWLDRRTDYTVTINPVTPVPRGRGVYIPHGHYRDRFAGLPRSAVVPGRLLYAGVIRPYKGVDLLLDAFTAIPDPSLRLRLVGKPSPELRRMIEARQTQDTRVSSRLAFVPDAELVAEMTTAELVCLPYRELHNSGILLVALSLDRPVLVPRTATTEALAQEVGPGWIYFFDAALQAGDLRRAIDQVRRDERAARPMLDGRDWSVVGQAYARAFLEGARLAGGAPVAPRGTGCAGGTR